MKITNTFLALLCSACLFAQENARNELLIKQKNGKEIYGVFSSPATSGRHGVAIISHGFNGTHHFGEDYFKTLNDLGYAVYTFDFPFGSVNSRSDNNTMNMSISDEKNALKDIVAYFRKQKDVDRNNIVLIGESQGGLVSALAAAELKNKVSDLVPIDYSKRAAATYGDAFLKIIDKAGHGFKPEERALSNRYVKEFLSR